MSISKGIYHSFTKTKYLKQYDWPVDPFVTASQDKANLKFQNVSIEDEHSVKFRPWTIVQ